MGIFAAGFMASAVQAGTVVRFNLNYPTDGSINYFDVELDDTQAPITVANFVQYVNNGLYNNTIIHRNVQDFVIQGGGYTPEYQNGYVNALLPITSYGPIQNEYSPARSNVLGTIAMAKLGNDPNSATNQWFVNVADNSSNLDNQNGGFTVFGKVIGQGMTLVNSINQLQPEDLSSYFGSPFDAVPLISNGTDFVTVTSASVISKATGKLTGYVYVDTNHNGIKDGADYAIADAKVSIAMDGGKGTVVAYSAADGSYYFSNLASGTYTVKMDTPMTLPGRDSGQGQMVFDADGNILNAGTAGTAQQNAYSKVWLGDAQTGANFNFAEEAYPATLLSARMLMNSYEGVPHTDSFAVPVTNPAAGSALDFGSVLVGKTGTAPLTVSNLGGQGSSLSGEFPGAEGDFGAAGATPYGPLAPGEEASRDYTYTPSERGQYVKDFSLTTDLGNQTVTFSGTGVAPVSSVTGSTVYALVNKLSTVSVNVQNVGDGNLSGLGDESNLIGSVAAGSGDFTGPGGPVNLADGASQSFDYTFTPTIRGEQKSIISASFDNGSQDGTNASHALDVDIAYTGVAPVRSVDTSAIDAGLVRIGTTATASIKVSNIGDGNLSGLGEESNLKGTIGVGSGYFGGDGGDINLPDAGEQTFNYTYTPVDRTTNSSTIAVDFISGSADGSNMAESVVTTLKGQGVGPIYSSDLTPDSTLEFGTVPQADTKTLTLEISNSSTDDNGGDTTLTDLTILSAAITGTDADLFTISGFTAGTVLHEGDPLSLEVSYNGTGTHGEHSAVLTFLTDEGAGFGLDGNSFTYQIHASLAPEPGTLVLLAFAGLALAGFAWRRRTNRKA